MSKKPEKKTRGRPPTKPATKVGPQFVGKTPEVDAQREALLNKRQAAVLAKYGHGLTYVREHLELRIRENMGRAVESVIGVGRDLLVMQAHEAHGEWLHCLRRIGIEPRHAQHMMAAAARIDALPAGGSAQKTLISSGAPSKLFDMLALSDKELAEIGDGTTDIDPEEIETMTVSELRRALRELRDDHATTSEKLGAVRQKADGLKDDLDAEKSRWRRLKPDEQRQKLERAVQIASDAVRGNLVSLGDTILNLLSHGDGETSARYCGGVIAELLVELQKVRDNETLPVAIPILSIEQLDG